MIFKKIKGWVIPFSLVCIILVVSTIINVYSATTVSVLDGKVSITDSANKNTVSGGTVTIKAVGSLFGTATNNITITNNSGATAKLSFDYSVSSASSFKIAGETAVGSGSYTVVLGAGGSLAITLVSNSGLWGTTATLTLSNFSLTEAASSSNVTIVYNSNYGSVKADGVVVNPNDAVSVSSETGVELVATATNGSTFLGWVDTSDNSRLSTEATFTLKVVEDAEVKAVFAKTSAWFLVDRTYLTDDLNKAGVLGTTIVLMNNGTLAAGDYTIQSDDTLLIPYDADFTSCTTKPTVIDSNATPTAFRTLTLASGANITVNGAISVSGSQSSKMGYNGRPIGALGFITMNSNSNITINNGGFLYAWGYITGSGKVVANDGATVYECFQVSDWRGGNATSDMVGNDKKVFPLSQYYVQNIEVPLTFYKGASEKVVFSVIVSKITRTSPVSFIGENDCMFPISSGSLTKDYDENTDRMIIDVSGEMSVSPFSVKVDGVLGIGDVNLDTNEYVLPLNSNITVNINTNSKVTLGQDLALLPGAQINIDDGASLILALGKKLIVYDSSEWNGYCSSTNRKFVSVGYAPGQKYTRTEADLVDAKVLVNGTIDASEGYIYTTESGANICSEGSGVIITKKGSETVTYQLIQNGNEVASWPEIKITPAKLKNADEKYVNTNLGNTTALTFYYCDGQWCNYKVTFINPVTKETSTEYLLYGYTLAEKYVNSCNNIPSTVEHGGKYYYHAETNTIVINGEKNKVSCKDCGATFNVAGTTDYTITGGYFSSPNYYLIITSGTSKYLIENVSVENNQASFTIASGIFQTLSGTAEYIKDEFRGQAIRLRGYQTNGGAIRFVGTIGTTGFEADKTTGTLVHETYYGIQISMSITNTKEGVAVKTPAPHTQRPVYTYLYNTQENGSYQFVDSYCFTFLSYFDKSLDGAKLTINFAFVGLKDDGTAGNVEGEKASTASFTINYNNGNIELIPASNSAN